MEREICTCVNGPDFNTSHKSLCVHAVGPLLSIITNTLVHSSSLMLITFWYSVCCTRVRRVYSVWSLLQRESASHYIACSVPLTRWQVNIWVPSLHNFSFYFIIPCSVSMRLASSVKHKRSPILACCIRNNSCNINSINKNFNNNSMQRLHYAKPHRHATTNTFTKTFVPHEQCQTRNRRGA